MAAVRASSCADDDDFDGLSDDDDVSGEMISLFHLAADLVQSNSSNIDDASLLRLYAHYKQATAGVCTTKKPGMFDFKGKSKWESWKKLSDMSKEEAMSHYIDTVKMVLGKEWDEAPRKGGYGASNGGAGRGMGVSVSTLRQAVSGVESKVGERSMCELVVEGDVDGVKKMLERDGDVVNVKDAQGMAPLHYAADRGLNEMAKVLLCSGADVNVRDDDDQTPLHYACCCEYLDVVKTLLEHSADSQLRCNEGLVPLQGTTNVDILNLLSS